MNDIFEAIKNRWNKFCKGVAEAIRNNDKMAQARYAGIALAAVLVAVALAVAALALVGKIIGKIFAVPFTLFVVLLILGKIFSMNQKKNRVVIGTPLPEETYEYVRDAMFLVLRAVSEYTNIVMPTRASAIEFEDNPYTIEDGYVVYHFLAKICGPIDIGHLKIDLTRTLRQMHRAHELNGIPRDLTEINGAYYCPLQIFGKPQDFGDYVQVSVVFATEKTVELTRANKLLNLDNTRYARRKQSETLTDDEL